MTKQGRHRYEALWFILCTLLSIFNVCTIYIFDGFDWPFYAVAANAAASLCGIVYHIGADESDHARGCLRQKFVSVLLALNSLIGARRTGRHLLRHGQRLELLVVPRRRGPGKDDHRDVVAVLPQLDCVPEGRGVALPML